MAKIRPEKASEKITISKFGGLRCTSALTGASAAEMRNFRISADGSLEKRTGTKALYNLGVPIRGLWQGSLGNEDYLLAVAGSILYAKLPGQNQLNPRKQLTSSTGDVSFLLYKGTLYMFDGSEVYYFSLSSKTFFKVAGYTPLYGDGWDPVQMGEVNQPINALSNKIRIRYNNTSGSTTFNLPFGVAQLGRVEVDGVQILPNPYTEGATSFSVPLQYAHGTLTVALVLADTYNCRATVAALNQSFLFADAQHNTVFLYGTAQEHNLIYSSPVSAEMSSESNRFFSVIESPLYFPLENTLPLADDVHPIHAIFRDRDRAIALNDRFAWALAFSGDRLISYPLEGGVGCSSVNGWALCGDRPVTIQTGGIFELRFPSGESDICIPEALSQEVLELLPASIFQNGILAWFPGRGELWMRDPTESEEGLVWVYKRDQKEWYCFDNLFITKFFELNGSVGFGTSDGIILLPDETSYADMGLPITATYRSQYIAFSSPENPKRSLRTTVCANTGGQQLTILTQTDSRSRAFVTPAQSSEKPQFFEYGMTIGRFRFARFLFSTTGVSSARIYRLSMLANI